MLRPPGATRHSREQRVQAKAGDARDLLQRFLEFDAGLAFDPPRELAQDARTIVALDREDEREAELRVVGGIERRQARELLRRALREARARIAPASSRR